MNQCKGFTLIELMIVVAIIAILGTIAIPSYQDRVIRAQVSEGLELADFVKKEIAEHYKNTKNMPSDNSVAGLPPADKIMGNYVSSVAVNDGGIEISYGNNVNNYLNGKTLSIRPSVVEGYPEVPIAWVCGKAKGVEKMKLMGVDRTDIPVPHLPMDCRTR